MPPLLPHILHTKIVTFVIFPATPRPVPSKKRQRFILYNSYRGGFAPMPRLLRSSPGNSRVAWPLPGSEVIQRVEIAESPVKCAFCGVCPPSFSPFIPSAISSAELRLAYLW